MLTLARPGKQASLFATLDSYAAAFDLMAIVTNARSYEAVDASFNDLRREQMAGAPDASPQVIVLGLASCDAISALYDEGSGARAYDENEQGRKLDTLLSAHAKAVAELRRHFSLHLH